VSISSNFLFSIVGDRSTSRRVFFQRYNSILISETFVDFDDAPDF